MSTYFLAARAGKPDLDSDHPPLVTLAATGASTAVASGVVLTAHVVGAAPTRAVPRPPPRRSVTLADLRARLRGVSEESAAGPDAHGVAAPGSGGGGGGRGGLPPATGNSSIVAAGHAAVGRSSSVEWAPSLGAHGSPGASMDGSRGGNPSRVSLSRQSAAPSALPPGRDAPESSE